MNLLFFHFVSAGPLPYYAELCANGKDYKITWRGCLSTPFYSVETVKKKIERGAWTIIGDESNE